MGLALKLTFSSPVATAEFSKFSGPSVNGCKKKKKRERLMRPFQRLALPGDVLLD